MGVYYPKVKKEAIKIGLLIIDEVYACYPPVADKGPGIVSFVDKESGKYKILFFEEGIETGLLDLDKDYYFGRIIDKKEAIDFFEKKLFSQRMLVKEMEEKLFLEKRKLENSEKAFSFIPDMIKKFSE